MLARVLAAFLIIVSACSDRTRDDHNLKVGAIAGPESELVEVAAKIAEQKFGIKVEIVTFEDYLLPNTALAEGVIDLNAYQHQAFLEETRTIRGYDLVSIGRTFVFPIAIYKGEKTTGPISIAIPQDPSNRARAINLLEKHDIKGKLIEMDAAMVPHALADVHYAVVNTSFANGMRLPEPAFTESSESPYANLIVAKRSNISSPKLRAFVCAFQTKAVREQAAKLFGSRAISAWKRDCDIDKAVELFNAQVGQDKQ